MGRDFCLTERGEQQAHALGRRLRAAGVMPQRLYGRQLTRAQQTVRVLCQYLPAPVSVRRDLIEHGSAVFLLDASYAEAVRRHPEQFDEEGKLKVSLGDGPLLN